MQELHLVGFTTEHDALIFSARKGAKSGGFVVALDDALYDTIDEAGRLRAADGDGEARRTRRAPRPESALSPRDIQRRLRAGRSIAHVATEAGVDEEWVMRFAVPILAEQAQVIAKAQSLVFAKARLGASGRPLGESVWWNVADKGALMAEDTFDQCWSALRLRDSMWIVRFDFINRKKRQRAEWEVDTREGTLHGRNRLASELGYVEPGRRGRPPVPLPPAAKPVVKKAAPKKRSASRGVGSVARTTAKKATARPAIKKKATKKKAAAKKRPAARKTATRKVAAKRAAPKKKTAARKAPAKKKVVARKAPAKKKAAPKRAAPKKAAARRPAPRKKATARKAATKRPARKRPVAKRTARSRPLQAPAFETPAFDVGEATRPVTIRAPRAIEPEPAPEPAPEPQVTSAPEPEPIPPPPVLTSTPSPFPRPEAAEEQRRFGRLRRRRPPSA